MSRVIGGRGKGRRLRTPRGDATRPTAVRVRQTLFDILGPRVLDARFLDLFAGSGAVGVEALSRGASRAVFVEQRREAVVAIRRNLEALGVDDETCRVMRGDALSAIDDLARAGDRFDLVFLDPPYDGDHYEPTLRRLDAGSVVAAGGWVIAEHFHKLALPATIGRLHAVRSVRVGDHLLTLLEPTAEKPE